MSKIFIIDRKSIIWTGGAIVFMLAILLIVKQGNETNILPASAPGGKEHVIHMLAVEFKGKTDAGKEIEVYSWHPGTVYVNKGEQVKLSIFGVNGKSHPFVIEGLNIQGEVKKGEETVVSFKADKAGIYRIVCWTHTDRDHQGPMIGYIVVA